ncbi:MAG: cardiolipin synthase ClsB [Archangium sp.]|nr:cardiolipin synthase ClsB [Archangium sp.]
MAAAALRTRWSVPPGRAPYAEVDLGPSRVALLKDGGQAFPAMLAAIRGATQLICLETYILRDDSTGVRFIEALMERARAGVEALLMYDAWGSDVSPETLRELELSGVKVLAFRPLRFAGSLGRFLVRGFRRNHRKSLTVDGVVAFTGGLNLCDDYAAKEDGGRGWRDTHVRIVGAGADAVEASFLAIWRAHRGASVRRPPRQAASCEKVRILTNDFQLHRKEIRRAYIDAFNRAKERIFVTNAYFLPPRKMMKALQRAARRGVRVAVVLAGATDVRLVLHAARGLYPKLLASGIEVYEWRGRILHAKTAVVDGNWATVGSANLDALSLRLNLEINAVFRDGSFGAAVERLFLDDLSHCEQVTNDTVRSYSWVQRAISWVAYQARHWL